MKKLPSRYALLALIALVLGVGLIAAAPAQATIQYFNIPDVTIYNTLIDPYNPEIPSGTGWDLTINNTAFFHLDLFGIDSYDIPISETDTITVSNGRAAGMTPLISGCETHGRNVTEGVSDLSYPIPEIYRLAANAPINSSTFSPTPPLAIEDFGFPLGGFAGRVYADLGLGFLNPTIRIGDWKPAVFQTQTQIVKGYVGFEIPDVNGGYHYGWIQVEVGPVSTFGSSNKDIQYLKIYDFAYEDVADAEILAGATSGGDPGTPGTLVPIPASVLLLGSGLMGLGLLGWRRKKS